MYREWQKDSSAVHKSWDVYFRNVAAGAPAGEAYAAPPTLGSADYAGDHQAAPPVAIAGGLQAASSNDPGIARRHHSHSDENVPLLQWCSVTPSPA